MDDLSSRVANLGIIEEEEDANALQPSSPQYIPGDEDVESITTLDEYYDARSQTSRISSLRTIKSSLSRMASASRESLVSVRCMLFAPSIGTLHMNTRQLAQYLGSKRRLSKTTILNMTTYRSQSVPRHMFVVLQLKEGHEECWQIGRAHV